MAALIGLALMVTVAAQAEDVQDVAALVGVDPQDLAGAVNSTGLPPHTYLQMTGDLPAPPSPAPPPPAYPVPIPSVWTALAACESSGRWSISTGNGYYGGPQEDLVFWRRYGGLAYAARPDLASPSAQIAVAQRGQASQGWAAWPRCSRLLGLR
jgi:hypothetical protein